MPQRAHLRDRVKRGRYVGLADADLVARHTASRADRLMALPVAGDFPLPTSIKCGAGGLSLGAA